MTKREELSMLIECIINGDTVKANEHLDKVTQMYVDSEVERRLDNAIVRVYSDLEKGK